MEWARRFDPSQTRPVEWKRGACACVIAGAVKLIEWKGLN
jgi:hypothetical protein